jgi:hypothetical protein
MKQWMTIDEPVANAEWRFIRRRRGTPYFTWLRQVNRFHQDNLGAAWFCGVGQ